MSKIVSLEEAIGMISDGDLVALGGNVLHRAPMAAVRELVRQKKKNLKLVKTAGAMDVDMLCLAGSVASVDAGFISYETQYGLAQHYRKGVQSGTIKGNEHACYTVICALRAAQMGVPFMPVKGLSTGDLLQVNDYFQVIQDPFGSGAITVVKALVPDVAILHVSEVDEKGNARIKGPIFEDVLLSRAAKKVIITAETIVPVMKNTFNPQGVHIPDFLVSAIVPLRGGARPTSCEGYYDIDHTDITAFKKVKEKIELDAYIASYDKKDHFINKGW